MLLLKNIVGGLILTVIVSGVGYLLLTGRVIAVAYWSLYSENELLSQQLHGNGCWFHYDRDQNGRCEFEWSYFDRALRNPEYHCPMRAAQCIAEGSSYMKTLLPELREVRLAMPEKFDTGDGVINFRECIDGAIRVLETSEYNDKLQVNNEQKFALLKCR